MCGLDNSRLFTRVKFGIVMSLFVFFVVAIRVQQGVGAMLFVGLNHLETKEKKVIEKL